MLDLVVLLLVRRRMTARAQRIPQCPGQSRAGGPNALPGSAVTVNSAPHEMVARPIDWGQLSDRARGGPESLRPPGEFNRNSR